MADDSDRKPSLDEAEAVTVQPRLVEERARLEELTFEGEHKERMQRANLGWLGRVFGSRTEKPGNITAIIAFILLGWLIGTTTWQSEKPFFSELSAEVFAIITLILGYLFGSSSKD